MIERVPRPANSSKSAASAPSIVACGSPSGAQIADTETETAAVIVFGSCAMILLSAGRRNCRPVLRRRENNPKKPKVKTFGKMVLPN